MNWMPCECPDDDHRHMSFPGAPHWPGERFMVRQALRMYSDANDDAPTRAQLLGVLTGVTGHLDFAEVMLDNALNFGTARETDEGRIVEGDDVPLRLLRPVSH